MTQIKAQLLRDIYKVICYCNVAFEYMLTDARMKYNIAFYALYFYIFQRRIRYLKLYSSMHKLFSFLLEIQIMNQIMKHMII